MSSSYRILAEARAGTVGIHWLTENTLVRRINVCSIDESVPVDAHPVRLTQREEKAAKRNAIGVKRPHDVRVIETRNVVDVSPGFRYPATEGVAEFMSHGCARPR